LHYAIIQSRVDAIGFLLEQGARLTIERDLSDDDNDDNQPLVFATLEGNLDAVEMIYRELQNRSIPKERILEPFQKACFKASQRGFTDIIEFFLLKGLGLHCHDGNGYRLRYHASTALNLPMIKLLVKYGARMENEKDTGVVSSYSRYDNDNSKAHDVVMYLFKSGCNVANGHRHACALWRLTRGFDRWRRLDHEVIELLQKEMALTRKIVGMNVGKNPQKSDVSSKGRR
jgi:ankyrin repeat protein